MEQNRYWGRKKKNSKEEEERICHTTKRLIQEEDWRNWRAQVLSCLMKCNGEVKPTSWTLKNTRARHEKSLNPSADTLFEISKFPQCLSSSFSFYHITNGQNYQFLMFWWYILHLRVKCHINIHNLAHISVKFNACGGKFPHSHNISADSVCASAPFFMSAGA